MTIEMRSLPIEMRYSIGQHQAQVRDKTGLYFGPFFGIRSITKANKRGRGIKMHSKVKITAISAINRCERMVLQAALVYYRTLYVINPDNSLGISK